MLTQNFTVDFLKALGSEVSRCGNRQMGAKREPKHVSVCKVEPFGLELVHEAKQNRGNVLELWHQQEVVRVH